MTAEPTDLERRLHAALDDAATRIHEAPRPALSWERPEVLAEVRALPRRRSGLRSALPWTLPAAAAALVTAALLGWSALHGTEATMRTTLLAPASSERLEPGQFLYTRVTERIPNGGQVVVETWQPQHARDEWTRRVTTENASGAPLGTPFTTTATCGNFDAGPGVHPLDPQPCDDQGSWQHITPQFLASLPTDPAALYQEIHDYVVSDYQKSSADRQIDLSEDNIAFLTMNYIAGIATDSGGMSEPFSQALEQATALVPGVTAGHATNLAGVGTRSYQVTAANGAVAGPLVFDADGNYVGRPDSAVVAAAADVAGTAPATR